MSAQQKYAWEKEHLGPGETAVYPTHPVVMACMIMDRYVSLAEANGKDEGKENSRAPCDEFLPGSGCAVHAGLDYLKYATTISLEAADKHAERYWANWEGQHQKNIESGLRGREQAAKLRNYLLERLAVWQTAADKGTVFRVNTKQTLSASTAD